MDGLRKRPNGDDASFDHQMNDPSAQPLLNPTPPIEENGDCGYQENQKIVTSSCLFASLCRIFVKWAKWLAAVLRRSLSWLGSIILCGRTHNKGYDLDLTPAQEERISRLLLRLKVSFDAACTEHQEALKALWYLCYPDIPLDGLVTGQWKQMGWQGNDPSTDFRGGGFTALENLLFFAVTYPKTFQQLLYKKGEGRASWEYPFAVAGVNITFMLIQMLNLGSVKASSSCGMRFRKILAEDERAFDLLYCVAFKLMDTVWLAMHASYMEFNAVLQATRAQLERELMMESVTRIEEMPSYSLLS